VEQILAWADAFHDQTGCWPHCDSGPVAEMPGDSWHNVDRALAKGNRGLRGGSSLARLLAERRDARNLSDLPDLTVECVLAWADAYYQRTGRWPRRNSGPIPEAPGESWETVANAFYKGSRGLPHDTLAAMLARHRGVRYRCDLPPLTVERIIRWAKAFHERTGRWPTHISGTIPEAPGETWGGIHSALQRGYRGLPGGSSLYRLLQEVLGVDRVARNRTRRTRSQERAAL
jgi:hypothetical protein